MDHSRAPLTECLYNYISQNRISFHMPGHKAGRNISKELLDLLGHEIFKADLTELPGTDDLHDPQGPILEAQELAADLFGAAKTIFTVNGATVGLQSSLLAATKPGDTVIVDRNMHRSIWAGMVLADIKPLYVMPRFLGNWGLRTAVSVKDLAQTLSERTSEDAKMLFLVHPTYEGISGEIDKLVAMGQQAGMKVAVDEAHGPHFHFHEALATSAIAAGADMVVHGSHKYLGSLTQTAMVHLNSEEFVEKVTSALRLLESSSPSFPLLASLDAARRTMALEGQRLWEEVMELAADFRREISRIDGVECLDGEDIGLYSGVYLDPTKIVLRASRLGYSGYDLANFLGMNKIDVELATPDYMLCLLSPGNIKTDFHKLLVLLQGLIPRGRMPSTQGSSVPPSPRVVLSPREAYYLPTRKLPLRETRGKLAGELVCPYPPGIPVLCPGEEITTEVIEYLLVLKRGGVRFQGIRDQRLESLEILGV